MNSLASSEQDEPGQRRLVYSLAPALLASYKLCSSLYLNSNSADELNDHDVNMSN